MKRKYSYDRDKICFIFETSYEDSRVMIEEGLKKIEAIIKKCNSKKIFIIDTVINTNHKINTLDDLKTTNFHGNPDIRLALKQSLKLDPDLTFVFTTNNQKLDIDQKDVPRCVLWIHTDETIPIDNFNNIGYIVKRIENEIREFEDVT